MRYSFAVVCLLSVALLSGCSQFRLGSEVVKDAMPQGKQIGTFKVGNPYKIQGQWYTPQESYSYDETGIASWYGPGFHNKRTANGEYFNQRELTAAHRTLQMPSFVRVTNLSNGRSVVVRVNDRGPFAKGRIIDVSEKAAELLDFKRNGTARVRVQVLPEASQQVAQAAREGRSWHGGDLNNAQPTLANSQYKPMPDGAPQPVAAPRTAVAQTSLPSAPTDVMPYEPATGQPVPMHTVKGQYYPDPVVTQQAVPAQTKLYVQLGSFSDNHNAQAMVSKASAHGQAFVTDVTVQGRTFHRVRLGPYNSVPEADAALNRVARQAPDAKIVVE